MVFHGFSYLSHYQRVPIFQWQEIPQVEASQVIVEHQASAVGWPVIDPGGFGHQKMWEKPMNTHGLTHEIPWFSASEHDQHCNMIKILDVGVPHL